MHAYENNFLNLNLISLILEFVMIIYSLILGLILLYLLKDFKRFQNNFKTIKRVFRIVMHRLRRSFINSRNKKRAAKMSAKSDCDTGDFKMFEVVRIRCAKKDFKVNSTSDEQEANTQEVQDEDEDANNFTFGVPTKRSGHRAVCNEESLYIWGGYCPIDEQRTPTRVDDNNEPQQLSPLFPEVILIKMI